MQIQLNKKLAKYKKISRTVEMLSKSVRRKFPQIIASFGGMLIFCDIYLAEN
jgi:hypothetical protein